MKYYHTSILAVLAVFTTVIGAPSSVLAQDTSEKATEAQVEVKKPSLTFYYIDQ